MSSLPLRQNSEKLTSNNSAFKPSLFWQHFKRAAEIPSSLRAGRISKDSALPATGCLLKTRVGLKLEALGINRWLFACGGHKVPPQLRISWSYSYKLHFSEACNTPVSICRRQIMCYTNDLQAFIFPQRKMYLMREEGISRDLALPFEIHSFIFKLCSLMSCLDLINTFL